MGFSRQEYWSGLPFPSPGDLPDPAIKPGSPTLQADALPSAPPGEPQEIKKHLDTSGNKNTMVQNLGGSAKAVKREVYADTVIT